MVDVGKNIKAARVAAGLTQEELADRVGYKTKSAINKIELGVRDLPQKKIAVFAEALGTTPGHLMGWDAEPEELGGVAAEVLMDPGLLQLVQNYLAMSEADQYALRLMAESLRQKKD